MTLQNQIAWFHFVATKQKLSLQTRGVYQYILELSLASGNGDIVISQDEMTAALATSKSVVNRSLKELDTFGIIGVKRGRISLTPPPASWLDKYSKRFANTVSDTESDTTADTSRSLRIITHGRKRAAGISSLPKGKDIPETDIADTAKIADPAAQVNPLTSQENGKTTAAQILAEMTPEQLRIFRQKDLKVQQDQLEQLAWLADNPNETTVSYLAFKQNRPMTEIELQLHRTILMSRAKETFQKKNETAQMQQVQTAAKAGIKVSI